jgi:alkylation response protein AidB-like acyl-CoA dehydrogenase
MLPRNFTEEQQMFRDAYRRFLSAEIVPHMEKWREAGIVDREAFRRAGEQGFLMVWPDEQYGGMGDDDFRFEQVIIEEPAYARVGDWYSTLHSRLVGPTSRASAALSSASATCPAACGARRSSPSP